MFSNETICTLSYDIHLEYSKDAAWMCRRERHFLH